MNTFSNIHKHMFSLYYCHILVYNEIILTISGDLYGRTGMQRMYIVFR